MHEAILATPPTYFYHGLHKDNLILEICGIYNYGQCLSCDCALYWRLYWQRRFRWMLYGQNSWQTDLLVFVVFIPTTLLQNNTPRNPFRTKMRGFSNSTAIKEWVSELSLKKKNNNNTDCIYTKSLRENKERAKGGRKQVTQQDKGAAFPTLIVFLLTGMHSWKPKYLQQDVLQFCPLATAYGESSTTRADSNNNCLLILAFSDTNNTEQWKVNFHRLYVQHTTPDLAYRVSGWKASIHTLIVTLYQLWRHK